MKAISILLFSTRSVAAFIFNILTTGQNFLVKPKTFHGSNVFDLVCAYYLSESRIEGH